MTKIINDAIQAKVAGNINIASKSVRKNDNKQGIIKGVKNYSDENSLVSMSNVVPVKSSEKSSGGNKIEILEQEAKNNKENINSITSSLDEIKDSIDESKNNKTQIENDISSMQQEYDDLVSKANNTEDSDEKNAIKLQAQNIKETLESSKEQLKETEDEIKNKEEELRNAEAQLEINQNNLSEAEKAIEEAKAQIEQKLAEENEIENKETKERFGIEEDIPYNKNENQDLTIENPQTDTNNTEIGITKETSNIFDKNSNRENTLESLPDINIPESHRSNYYQIYSDMLNDDATTDAANKAAEILMHDSSAMSSESMKLTPGELKEKLKDIYTKGNSDLLDPSKTGGESIDEIVNAMVDIPIKYGLNAEWFAAKIMTESDLVNVNNDVNVNKHNITGWTAGSDSNTGKVTYASFDTITECLEKTAGSLKTGSRYKEAANIKELNGIYNLGNKDAASEEYTTYELKRMFVLWNYKV